jgi:S1-C subfamily serine protease
VVAGTGHVDFGWGVAQRLDTLDHGAKVLAVTPWRGVEGFEPGAADVFYFCPNVYVSRMGMVLEETRDGLKVAQVERGSRADQAGLRPGDRMVSIRGRELDSLTDLHLAGAKAYKDGAPLVVKVRRDKETLTIDLGKLGER